jgi:MiaB-like tRNA modifying enzyme
MKVFLETFGCTANKADSEILKGLLKENNFEFTSEEKADFLVINSCGVKEQTENKVIKRIKTLSAVFPEKKLIVFGCLPKINSKKIFNANPKAIQFGTDLNEISAFFGLSLSNSLSLVPQENENKFVSIIPIAKGCLSNCAFCATRIARGTLKSHSINEIKEKFEKSIKISKEVWLTSQDNAVYGFDLKTNLASLLQELCKINGKYRIRVGMMNPRFIKGFLPELLKSFESKKVYKFFHIPLQSGSNEVLFKMKRFYTVEEFYSIIEKIKKKFFNATISTDIIVGFPGETEKQFNETMKAIKELKPTIVNISRFGLRPNTFAVKLSNQLHGRIKKERSRKLSRLCRKIAFDNHKALVGEKGVVLFTEKGKNNFFVGRNENYVQVIVKSNKNLLGKFVKVEFIKNSTHYLIGRPGN